VFLMREAPLFLMDQLPLFLTSEVPVFLMREAPLFLMSKVPLFLMSKVPLFLMSEAPTCIVLPGCRVGSSGFGAPEVSLRFALCKECTNRIKRETKVKYVSSS
jgi:hypothetical protein